ncbi:hypothetical protein EXN66_Car021349 [Channa argus]|uniref:Uncharacterized protein n=1 Tax=Channa argus TaxID=215402 RepID=A0A6G1QTW4_CHAAH|nr:hypothetical protein EXN66_Car021349 [Channa argus]
MKALSQTQASYLDVNKPLTQSLLLGDPLFTQYFCSFLFFLLHSCAISCNFVYYFSPTRPSPV